MQDVDGEAALCRLPQTIGDQWMFLAQGRSHHEHALQCGDLRDFHAEPTHTDEFPIGTGINLPQTRIDIVRAESAHDLVQQIQLFERLMRRCKCGERFGTLRRLDLFQPFGDGLQGDRPIHFGPRVTDFHHRLRQTIIGIQSLIRETILVRQPALVDCVVFQWQFATHDPA